MAGSPVIGRRRGTFSTLLRRPGLQASSDGVLATKRERIMLASTCLYSLYAWFTCTGRTDSLHVGSAADDNAGGAGGVAELSHAAGSAVDGVHGSLPSIRA